jgi:hypothetical protein
MAKQARLVDKRFKRKTEADDATLTTEAFIPWHSDGTGADWS